MAADEIDVKGAEERSRRKNGEVATDNMGHAVMLEVTIKDMVVVDMVVGVVIDRRGLQDRGRIIVVEAD